MKDLLERLGRGVDIEESKGTDYVMYWDPKDRKRAAKFASDAADAMGSFLEFAYRNPGGSSPREAAKAMPGNLYNDIVRIIGVLEMVYGQLSRG
jgi:hypothetical protein